MENNNYGQIHLIPFDIGFMFYDVLSKSNTKNIEFGKSFIQKLREEKYQFLQIGFCYKGNQSSQEKDKTKDLVGKIDTNVVENEKLCMVKLSSNLYCYISNTGIAIFVLADFNKQALGDRINGGKDLELPIQMCVQKKITNEALMSTRIEKDGDKVNLTSDELADLQENWPNVWPKPTTNETFNDVFSEERKMMFKFQNDCWKIIRQINKEDKKKFNFPCVRPYTSNPYFKNFGFSYSMNIMIGKNLKPEYINYLLNGGAPRLDFASDTYWTKAKNHYYEIKDFCKNNIDNIVYAGPYKIHFSWSSIIVDSNKEINSMKDVVEEEELMTLLYAELAIQCRWFNADNCINNSIENHYSKIENLQTLQGYIEYCSAQLENTTSSCASSLYLQYEQQIVKTSKIIELYKSISDRMKAQKEIKLQYSRKRSNRLLLITDILLGCFTGASLFKTIWDLATKDFQWWSIVSLIGTILIFIGIQCFIYNAKKEK